MYYKTKSRVRSVPIKTTSGHSFVNNSHREENLLVTDTSVFRNTRSRSANKACLQSLMPQCSTFPEVNANIEQVANTVQELSVPDMTGFSFRRATRGKRASRLLRHTTDKKLIDSKSRMCQNRVKSPSPEILETHVSRKHLLCPLPNTGYLEVSTTLSPLVGSEANLVDLPGPSSPVKTFTNCDDVVNQNENARNVSTVSEINKFNAVAQEFVPLKTNCYNTVINPCDAPKRTARKSTVPKEKSTRSTASVSDNGIRRLQDIKKKDALKQKLQESQALPVAVIIPVNRKVHIPGPLYPNKPGFPKFSSKTQKKINLQQGKTVIRPVPPPSLESPAIRRACQATNQSQRRTVTRKSQSELPLTEYIYPPVRPAKQCVVPRFNFDMNSFFPFVSSTCRNTSNTKKKKIQAEITKCSNSTQNFEATSTLIQSSFDICEQLVESVEDAHVCDSFELPNNVFDTNPFVMNSYENKEEPEIPDITDEISHCPENDEIFSDCESARNNTKTSNKSNDTIVVEESGEHDLLKSTPENNAKKSCVSPSENSRKRAAQVPETYVSPKRVRTIIPNMFYDFCLDDLFGDFNTTKAWTDCAVRISETVDYTSEKLFNSGLISSFSDGERIASLESSVCDSLTEKQIEANTPSEPVQTAPEQISRPPMNSGGETMCLEDNFDALDLMKEYIANIMTISGRELSSNTSPKLQTSISGNKEEAEKLSLSFNKICQMNFSISEYRIRQLRLLAYCAAAWALSNCFEVYHEEDPKIIGNYSKPYDLCVPRPRLKFLQNHDLSMAPFARDKRIKTRETWYKHDDEDDNTEEVLNSIISDTKEESVEDDSDVCTVSIEQLERIKWKYNLSTDEECIVKLSELSNLASNIKAEEDCNEFQENFIYHEEEVVDKCILPTKPLKFTAKSKRVTSCLESTIIKKHPNAKICGERVIKNPTLYTQMRRVNKEECRVYHKRWMASPFEARWFNQKLTKTEESCSRSVSRQKSPTPQCDNVIYPSSIIKSEVPELLEDTVVPIPEQSELNQVVVEWDNVIPEEYFSAADAYDKMTKLCHTNTRRRKNDFHWEEYQNLNKIESFWKKLVFSVLPIQSYVDNIKHNDCVNKYQKFLVKRRRTQQITNYLRQKQFNRTEMIRSLWRKRGKRTLMMRKLKAFRKKKIRRNVANTYLSSSLSHPDNIIAFKELQKKFSKLRKPKGRKKKKAKKVTTKIIKSSMKVYEENDEMTQVDNSNVCGDDVKNCEQHCNDCDGVRDSNLLENNNAGYYANAVYDYNYASDYYNENPYDVNNTDDGANDIETMDHYNPESDYTSNVVVAYYDETGYTEDTSLIHPSERNFQHVVDVVQHSYYQETFYSDGSSIIQYALNPDFELEKKEGVVGMVNDPLDEILADDDNGAPNLDDPLENEIIDEGILDESDDADAGSVNSDVEADILEDENDLDEVVIGDPNAHDNDNPEDAVIENQDEGAEGDEEAVDENRDEILNDDSDEIEGEVEINEDDETVDEESDEILNDDSDEAVGGEENGVDEDACVEKVDNNGAETANEDSDEVVAENEEDVVEENLDKNDTDEVEAEANSDEEVVHENQDNGDGSFDHPFVVGSSDDEAEDDESAQFEHNGVNYYPNVVEDPSSGEDEDTSVSETLDSEIVILTDESDDENEIDFNAFHPDDEDIEPDDDYGDGSNDNPIVISSDNSDDEFDAPQKIQQVKQREQEYVVIELTDDSEGSEQENSSAEGYENDDDESVQPSNGTPLNNEVIDLSDDEDVVAAPASDARNNNNGKKEQEANPSNDASNRKTSHKNNGDDDEDTAPVAKKARMHEC